MKTLRFAIAAVAVLGSVSAFATNARIEAMGKSSAFIMDDISIFDNPANMNLYPNFLIGELGTYSNDVDVGKNKDPLNPWFGGIFSLDIGGGNSLSIGGVLNRKDEKLYKYFPDKIHLRFDPDYAPIPVTDFDGFLGANFDNKAVGLHVYWVHQDGLSGDGKINSDAFVSALQLDGGINFELSSNYSIEVAAGLARIQYGPSDRDFFDGDLFSAFANARFFSKVQAINGHLIPIASFRNMNAPGRDEMDVSGGLGVDAAFDRGFFWLGLTGFYNVERADKNWSKDSLGITTFRDAKSMASEISRLWQFGGTISFGIERNIWWDWFVIRVGGQKKIAYADFKNKNKISNKDGVSILCPSNDPAGCESGNYFVTNPVNDGTRDDHVGFGIGINIEEKLKVDATIAEDLLFRNPFQGGGRLISKISATYSF